MQFFKNPRKVAARVAAALLGGLLLASPNLASADDMLSIDSVLGDDAPFSVGGWTQFGYHTDNNGVFNNHEDRVNLHQQWLYVEREADGSDGLDFGFRVDALYGVDAQNTQAFGEPAGANHWDNQWDNGIYGFAMPQAYIEMAAGDFKVKAGHFYTIIGYEVVTAPDNFFYSHAFTFNFNEPFTHTGVLGEYAVSDDITVYGGWTAGWDTGFDRFNDGDNTDGSNFLGGVSVSLSDDVTATFATTIGDFGVIGEGYMHSVVVDVALTDDLQYVFHHDYLRTNGNPGDSYSLNNYLIYNISDELAAGVRAEWWDLDNNSIYQITTGLNIKPMENVIIRPEVRWQFGEDNAAEQFFGNNLGIPTGDTIFGVDAILTY